MFFALLTHSAFQKESRAFSLGLTVQGPSLHQCGNFSQCGSFTCKRKKPLIMFVELRLPLNIYLFNQSTRRFKFGLGEVRGHREIPQLCLQRTISSGQAEAPGREVLLWCCSLTHSDRSLAQ